MTIKVGDTVKVKRGLLYEVDAIDDDGKLTVTIVGKGKRDRFCTYSKCEPHLFGVVASKDNA